MRRAALVFALVLGLVGFSPSVAPAITGTEHVALILVTFDGSQPWTLTQAQTVADQSAGMYASASGGAYSFTSSVLGYYTIAQPPSCDPGAIQTEARAVAGDLSAFEHVGYVFPAVLGCPWAGAAEQPGDEMWFNGLPGAQTFAHELGHNLGLGHANGPGGQSQGDSWTVMGYGATSFTGWERAELGWLTSTAVGVGTWTLTPLDSAGQRLLTIGDLALDYRPDLFGVTIRRVGLPGNATEIIPAGGTGCTCYYPLNLGQSWQDPTSGLWFTTTARNASGATVVIGSAPATTTTSTTSTTQPPATTTTTRKKKH